ncbi:PA domain [Fragilaria crotonensis]|nr:PA domain [Fragilaria crotonensis]
MNCRMTKAIQLCLTLIAFTLAHSSERELLESNPSHSNKRVRGDAYVQERRAKKADTKHGYEESSTGQETSRASRVFVEYHGAEGRKAILDRAKSIIKEYTDENSMVVEIDEDSRKTLLAHDLIKGLESDEPVEGFGSIHRHLLHAASENIPWGIGMIQADQLPIGPYPVKVCIADTGYGLGHPDLPSRGKVNGNDAVSKTGELWSWNIDFNGHGTHIAGTIAALGRNNIGVRGAGDIPLHITRSLDDKSGGFESDVLDAVDQCVASGAKIINLSLGGDVMSERSRLKYEKIVNQLGVMVVAAAGNQGQNRQAYPASHPAVISVTAIYAWKNYWEGSNFSNQVELAAPGHNILSTTTTLTAIHTIDYSFTSTQVGGSRTLERSGNLFDCGSGNVVCVTPKSVPAGGICIMSRDRTPLNVMILNCQRAGGYGTIIFEANPVFQQNAYSAKVDIPAVVVPTVVGIRLLDYVGTKVSIGFHESDEPEWTYASFQGTSMAVPHVVSAAALVWSYFPKCTNQEIRFALAISAEDRGLAGCDWDYGHGIVKALNAKKWLDKNPCGSGNVANRAGGCSVTRK